MSGIEILGIFSALLALIAFVGNQYGMLRNDDFSYDLLNFLSAIGLMAYAFSTNALPFIMTNTVWAMVSGVDVIKYIYGRFAHKKSSHRR